MKMPSRSSSATSQEIQNPTLKHSDAQESRFKNSCICLEVEDLGHSLVKLTCGHAYHPNCLSDYVSSRLRDAAQETLETRTESKIAINCPDCRSDFKGIKQRFTGTLGVFIFTLKNRVPATINKIIQELQNDPENLSGPFFNKENNQKARQNYEMMISYVQNELDQAQISEPEKQKELQIQLAELKSFFKLLFPLGTGELQAENHVHEMSNLSIKFNQHLFALNQHFLYFLDKNN